MLKLVRKLLVHSMACSSGTSSVSLSEIYSSSSLLGLEYCAICKAMVPAVASIISFWIFCGLNDVGRWFEMQEQRAFSESRSAISHEPEETFCVQRDSYYKEDNVRRESSFIDFTVTKFSLHSIRPSALRNSGWLQGAISAMNPNALHFKTEFALEFAPLGQDPGSSSFSLGRQRKLFALDFCG